jgi:hypothetical protein
MSGGSYLRFVVGLVLSILVLVSFFSGDIKSPLLLIVALIFLGLTALWTVFRF